MDPEDATQLLEALASAGWVVRGAWIYAPRGTMWLSVREPWHEDLVVLLERMVGRIERARQNGLDDVVADTQSLVDVLKQLLGGR